MNDPAPADPTGTPAEIAAHIEDPATGSRPPGFVERKLVGPLLEVVSELDPRLPGVADVALAVVDHMLMSAVKRAFRWIWLSVAVLVIGLLAAVGTSGWARVATIVLVVLPAATITVGAMVLRALTLHTVRGVTGSYARPEQNQVIADAVRRGKLPRGPITLGLMMLRTVVRGPRHEVRRIHALAHDLALELGEVEPDAAPDATPDPDATSGPDATPDDGPEAPLPT